MEIEIQGLNPVLNDMVEREQLSPRKIAGLVVLKELVDRFAGSLYVSDLEAEKLHERYGVYPDIRTWGDYFQTEIASQHFDKAEPEFATILDTIRFDLISSCMIFDGKPAIYLHKVEEAGIIAAGYDSNTWTEEQMEAAHLNILRQYFLDMGLSTKALSTEDHSWFSGFCEAAARAV